LLLEKHPHSQSDDANDRHDEQRKDQRKLDHGLPVFGSCSPFHQ
jgi:hypothetical protein